MYLVFDIGGTKLRLSRSSDGEKLDEVKIFATPEDYKEGIQLIVKTAKELAGQEKIPLLAGGIPGPLDSKKSQLLNAPNLPGWNGKPLRKDLEEMLMCQVYIENDSALVGLGEATFGVGTGKKIVAYITISTGVGGVRIIEGKIDTSSLGFEPGHQIIVVNGEICSCRGKGHLEAYVSGNALQRKYNKAPEEIDDPKVWEQVTEYLAIGLNNTIVHWSPDIVVLGGGLMKSVSIDLVSQKLKEVMTIFPTPPPLIKASLGDRGGLMGALVLAKSHIID